MSTYDERLRKGRRFLMIVCFLLGVLSGPFTLILIFGSPPIGKGGLAGFFLLTFFYPLGNLWIFSEDSPDERANRWFRMQLAASYLLPAGVGASLFAKIAQEPSLNAYILLTAACGLTTGLFVWRRVLAKRFFQTPQ